MSEILFANGFTIELPNEALIEGRGINVDHYGKPGWLKQMEAERWVEVYKAMPDIHRMMRANSTHAGIIPESYLKSRIQEYNELLIAREKLVINLNIKYPLKRSRWRLRVKR